MNKIIITTAISLIIVFSFSISTLSQEINGTKLDLTVRQKPAGIDKYYEIISDTLVVALGFQRHLTLVNMNIDVDLESVDSQYVSFTSHLTTMGRKIHNESRRFRIEYNLPGRIENIPGKNGSTYQLLISPIDQIVVDTSRCQFDASKDYAMDPTANFDIYYVPGSLGDFTWVDVKNYIEFDYQIYKRMFQFTTSSKTSLYLCPCPDRNMKWDNRFGFAIDVGRTNIYAMHNHRFSGVDVILPNMLLLLKIWGYAPPFIVEGLAGYLDFSKYKMKKIVAEGRKLNLKDLMTSQGYYSAEPNEGEVTAISFSRFLLDQYGLVSMKKLYATSDDLTLLKNISEIYEKSLESLETEWLHYVDTLQLTRQDFDLNAARTSSLRRFDDQLEYIEQMTDYCHNHSDSLDTWKKLSAMYYQIGEYYSAIGAYHKLIELDEFNPLYIHILGNLEMITGEYDKAYKYFDSVYTLDYNYTVARLLQAKIKAIKGDSAGAIAMAEEFYPREKEPLPVLDFLIFLGDMYKAPGALHDSVKAEEYYTEALIQAQRLEAKAPQEFSLKLRAGQALVGLGKYDQAQYYLEIVTFAEIRTFYICKALVALGKSYDGKGDREAALEFYRLALATPITDYDRIEALRYIDKPYGR